MQQFKDPNGLTFTASHEASAAAFARLTSAYMGFRRDTGQILKDLLGDDPDMPMALCAKGYFAKLIASEKQSRRALDISRGLDAHVAAVSASEREKGHAAALSAWCNGYLNGAAQIWEDILLEHPQDGLALRLAHFAHFYSGDGRRMRDSLARTLPRWSEDHPDYGFVLGMYAFGLEEACEYSAAEKFGRRAVERNREDAWSVHAVAHVLEMTGRHGEGIQWVNDLEDTWSTVNNFRFHLYWHRCLYHLERGEFDEVLKVYDQQLISDIESDFYLDMCNATSLLWRLEMFGIDVGNRWHKLAEVSRAHAHDQDLIFVSLHYLMALVAAGDNAAADELIDNLHSWCACDTEQARVCADAGLAIAESLRLVRTRDFEAAADRLDRVRYQMDCIGGSMAQRDVFHMILLDAVMAGKNALKARALFAERVEQKVHSSWSWNGYGRALKALGLDPEATVATRKAAEIGAAN